MTANEKKAAVDEVVRFIVTALSMHYGGTSVKRAETTAGSQMVRLELLPDLTINLVITPARS